MANEQEERDWSKGLLREQIVRLIVAACDGKSRADRIHEHSSRATRVWSIWANLRSGNPRDSGIRRGFREDGSHLKRPLSFGETGDDAAF